jgi:hypothetical protein
LQRFVEGSPPLFTQSFHIYKFIEWHRCTFVDYVWGSCPDDPHWRAFAASI